MGSVLTIDMLKKLKKDDLIQIILNMQTSSFSSSSSATVASESLTPEQEADRKLKAYYKNNKPEPRPKPNYNYICTDCSSEFYDDISVFRKGANDPRCKKCRSNKQ